MTNQAPLTSVDRVLGLIGLFLMLAVATAVNRTSMPRSPGAGLVSDFVARRVIEGVAAIGWLFDRLPFANRVIEAGPCP